MSGSVNASIPLAFNPTQPAPDIGRAIDFVGGYQTLQANAQKMAGQNAMRAIFANPQNLDESGMPKPNAINQIMAVDPDIGMKLMANKQALYKQQMDANLERLNITGKQEDMIRGVGDAGMTAYLQAKDAKNPNALQIGQDAYSQAFKRLMSSGLLAPYQSAGLSSAFDPIRTESNMDYLKRRAADRADATQLREEGHEIAWQQHNRDMENKGWQVLSDPTNKDSHGNPTQFRYNPNTSEATTLDGKPYTAGGAAKLAGGGKGSTSDLLSGDALDKAALWYHATHELPAGMGGWEDKKAIIRRESEMFPTASAGADVARVALVKAARGSLNNLTKQADAANAYSTTADKEFDLVLKNLPDTAEPLNSQMLTRWARTGEKQFNDLKLPVYQTYLVSGLDEYAKILSGATGAAASTDSARQQALSLIPEGASSKVIPKIVEAIKAGIKNRQDGYKDQLADIQDRLAGTSDQDNSPTAQPGSAGGSGRPSRAKLPQANSETPPAELPKPDDRGVYQDLEGDQWKGLPPHQSFRMKGDPPGMLRVMP